MPTLEAVFINESGKEVVQLVRPCPTSPQDANDSRRPPVTPPQQDKQSGDGGTQKKGLSQASISSFFSKRKPGTRITPSKQKIPTKKPKFAPVSKTKALAEEGFDIDELREIALGKADNTEDISPKKLDPKLIADNMIDSPFPKGLYVPPMGMTLSSKRKRQMRSSLDHQKSATTDLEIESTEATTPGPSPAKGRHVTEKQSRECPPTISGDSDIVVADDDEDNAGFTSHQDNNDSVDDGDARDECEMVRLAMESHDDNANLPGSRVEPLEALSTSNHESVGENTLSTLCPSSPSIVGKPIEGSRAEGDDSTRNKEAEIPADYTEQEEVAGDQQTDINSSLTTGVANHDEDGKDGTQANSSRSVTLMEVIDTEACISTPDVDESAENDKNEWAGTSMTAQLTDGEEQNVSPTRKMAQSAELDSTSKKGTNKAKATVNAASCSSDDVLPQERVTLIKKNQELRARYLKCTMELSERILDRLEEEKFEIPKPANTAGDTQDEGEDFPKQATSLLAACVQESSLPLSQVAKEAFDMLLPAFPNLTLDAVVNKVKLLFTRESYFVSFPERNTATNCHEDSESTKMWRWEIIVLELLPESAIPKVKKARSARRKLRKFSKSLANLLAALDEAEKVLSNTSSSQKKCDNIMAKVSNEEERVLKFEREEEKARIVNETKRKKEEAKLEKLRLKQAEKEKKLKVKEKNEAEKRLAKEKAAQIREDRKRKKEEARGEEKRKERIEHESRLKKQKTIMMSFLSKQEKKVPSPSKEVKDAADGPRATAEGASSKLWSLIDSCSEHTGSLFPQLTSQAKESRKRRTDMIPTQVEVPAVSADPFSGRPFSEFRTIQVFNKFKFLSFFEDHRPPYCGTWSKTSKIVTGRTPMAKDVSCLDYDVDSEAEWEEGDAEIGEDLQDETADGEEENMDPDEGDTRKYNYADGWLADDDELVYENEDIDNNTKHLRKEMKTSIAVFDHDESEICVIAPLQGGLPLSEQVPLKVDLANYVEGAKATQECLNFPWVATDAVTQDVGNICLDPFPPLLVDESFAGNPSSPGNGKGGMAKVPTSNEMSRNDMKVFATFIHHSTLASKGRVVEELRKAHPDLTSSRAQAMRKLESIAIKTRHPKGGALWEIKEDVLDELGLEKLKNMKVAADLSEDKEESATDNESEKSGSSKKKSAGAASSANQAKATGSAIKRKLPEVSTASVNLMANFFIKKPKKDPVNDGK